MVIRVSLTLLSIVEMNVGVMCSCMPAFAKFFRCHPILPRTLSSVLNITLKKLNQLISGISNRIAEKSLDSPLERNNPLTSRQPAHQLTLGTGFGNAQEQGLGLSQLDSKRHWEVQQSKPALTRTVEEATLKSQDFSISASQVWDFSSSEAQGSAPGTSRSESHIETQASSPHRRRHWWEIEGIITDFTLSRTEK